MIRKTNYKPNKVLNIVVLFMLCFAFMLNNPNTIEVCHALASWNPITGFQPGIGVDIGGSTGFDPIIINPNIGDLIYANSDNSLKAYDSLTVRNSKINTEYGGWKYASFVEYFKIVRTDGRKIYDDDGYLDVSWWNSNGTFGNSDEIIDYKSEIWVKTTVMPYNYNGFMNTILNTKFQSGAMLELTWDRGQDPEDSIISYVHDLNANTMGSGNYRNNGVNPGNEYYKLANWDYYTSPYITISLYGTGYWENGWWGGTGGHTNINAFLSGFMPRSNRVWANSLIADAGVKVIGNTLYSAKPFVATATNLNNFVKINNNRVTPITNQNVIPFKEGLRIAIAEEGMTKVSIENGAENNYIDYYCVIDSQLPNVNLVYSNPNALDKVKENAVQKDSLGIKSQLITGGIFKDQIQVNFGAIENQSPETAFIIHNGTTTQITSGTWLTNSGDYTLVVQDAVGNKKTIQFTIDNSNPIVNVTSLQNEKGYKVSKWHLTSVPYGFNDYGVYAYLTYEQALEKAVSSERQNLVTNHYLNNISDFHFTNLIASGDTVKLGPYWYYKAKDNANLYVYYFSENLLNEALENHAKSYVSLPQYYNYKSDIFPNNYGNFIDASVYHNVWNESDMPAYIGNNFIFRKADELETYKVFYHYADNQIENWTEVVYNIPFKQQATNHGLYLIKEMDYVGHETYYYLFLDLLAPKLNVTAKVHGSQNMITHMISQNDIPANNELVFYYEEFQINQIIDDDTWYVLQIKSPSGTTRRYTHIDTLPNFQEFGTGEFQITLYDRLGNNFSFKVYLLGKSPRVRFETINTNTQLRVSIISGEEFNQITKLNIYRNNVLLNNEFGYDEYPEDDSNALIFISPSNKQYIFNKGGLYKIEITDNFGRVTTHEFKFEKNLPIGILKGVTDNGKTNQNVQFVYNETKYIAIVFKNGIEANPYSYLDSSGILTNLDINANSNTNDNYEIYLYDKTDFENFNIYKFTIKTIPPEFYLYGVADNGTTANNVYALWDVQNQYSSKVSFNNGQEKTYLSGELLIVEGTYKITLTDEIGNINIKTFTIDRTLDFTIFQDGIQKQIQEIRYTNKSVQFINNEPLNIEILKDGVIIKYAFGTYINNEGNYLVKVFDDYGNTKYFEFEIDKTNTFATLIGVENNGITSGFVQVIWEEENLTSHIYKENIFVGIYTSGSEIKLNGKYQVIVKDRANNSTQFSFIIDNKIEYEINTFYDGISNGGVRVIAKEELTIEMFKDGEVINYSFEQILNEDGMYHFYLTDELGNQEGFKFRILNTPLNRIENKLHESVEITEIKMNGQAQQLHIQNNTLYLIDEGQYNISIKEKSTNKIYSFNLEIDTTPPTIQLVGVVNGEQTKNDVSTKNPSETPIFIQAKNNDLEFEYKIGQVIKNVGTYEIIVMDQAGNYSVYTFTKTYSFNASTLALFGGMLALVVILIVFLVKTKSTYYKGNAEILTTAEITEEIDNIEKR